MMISKLNDELGYIERYAVGLSLSNWPFIISLPELLAAIAKEDEKISIWEQFENNGADWVIGNILNDIENLTNFVKRLPAELKEVKV